MRIFCEGLNFNTKNQEYSKSVYIKYDYKVNVPISAPVRNSAPLYLFSIVKKIIWIFFIEKIENTSTIHQL